MLDVNQPLKAPNSHNNTNMQTDKAAVQQQLLCPAGGNDRFCKLSLVALKRGCSKFNRISL